jgi:Carboxypeptidase regulatory-like domain
MSFGNISGCKIPGVEAGMKPIIYALLGLLAAPITLGQTAPRNAPPGTQKQNECSVAGIVVKLAGSEPLKSANVQLLNMDDHSRGASTVTDVGGRFELKGIDPGRYRLKVARTGFVTQEYGQRTPNDPGAVLTLRAGQSMRDLLFRLIQWGVIAGRVINEEGEPLPWTQVSALREIYTRGKRTLYTETTVPTNDLGEYRLFGLRPGRYFVSAKYRPGEHLIGKESVEETEEDSGPQGYVPTFYPGSADPTKAVALAIKAAEEIPSVEILLRPVEVFKIKGRVYSMLSRRSWDTTSLSLEQRGGGLQAGIPVRQALVDKPDGSFTIADVLPGAYVLIAYSYEDGRAYQARQNIDVGSADLEGVVITIAPPVAVSGRVVWEGPPSVERDPLAIVLNGADTTHALGSRARVTPQGGFTLYQVFEGPYRLGIAGQSKDCFVKAVRYGATDGLEDGFNVVRGANAQLEVTISSKGAHVQGTVTDADDLPAVGVWVVLVPDEAHRSQSRFYKATTTDQNGHFDLQGIAPGDYKLFSWDEVETGAWEDPDFLKPFESKGVNISFEEGDQKSEKLVTIRTKSPD